MRMPKRGEKGFTLIELLIVVAILGVLAAVVIPNVGRFIGRGKTEAIATELTNVQSAVQGMMMDNNLTVIPHPISGTTNDMDAFPDVSSNWTITSTGGKVTDTEARSYAAGDRIGYLLYHHDRIGSDGKGAGGTEADNATLSNYVATRYTKGTYSVTAAGEVTQVTTGY